MIPVNIRTLMLAAALTLGPATARATGSAAGLDVALASAAGNPGSPTDGRDRLASCRRSAMSGSSRSHGLVAWLSLVRMDKCDEAPVDL